ILLLSTSLLTACGGSSGGKTPEVATPAIPEVSASGADTLTVTWADMLGNVTESIENGSVTINNNLMVESVTEMMPTGDYKTEVTAMNYETMFMVNGEHKVMDMSTKKTVYDLAITDWTFGNPRSTLDINIVSEIFSGLKNTMNLAMATDIFVGVKLATHSGPIVENKQGQLGRNNLHFDDVKFLYTTKCLTKIEKASLFL